MKKFPLLIFFLVLLNAIAFSQEITKCLSSNGNLRNDSIIGNNVISVIPRGTCLTGDISLFEKNWIYIEYDGQQGYIHSSLFVKNEIGIDQSSSSYTNYNSSGSSNSNNDYYINSKGERVKSPSHSSNIPAGATAICNDGTYSYSQSRRGTCSHHGGVKQWLNN
jgi:hypothetical protein